MTVSAQGEVMENFTLTVQILAKYGTWMCFVQTRSVEVTYFKKSNQEVKEAPKLKPPKLKH